MPRIQQDPNRIRSNRERNLRGAPERDGDSPAGWGGAGVGFEVRMKSLSYNELLY